MAKRYEVRIDESEFRELRTQAALRGFGSVAELFRSLAREDMRRQADDAIVVALSRASEPKVR